MINESTKAIVLGSKGCSPFVHRKYSCGSSDYLLTSMDLDSETGTLTIYLNPNNCISLTINELLYLLLILKDISTLIDDKVDKTYFLNTKNGILGGGTFQESLTLSIKGKDPHIDTTDGLSIKKFTDVITSGVVPCPDSSKRTSDYYLNALGQWTKLGVLTFKGVIESNITIANPSNGDMYIIKDLGDPTLTVTVNGKQFKSTDVIVWNDTEFIDIGLVSIRVNLSLAKNSTSNTINNSAGLGVTLSRATTTEAGLMASEDKETLDTLNKQTYIVTLNDFNHGVSTVSLTGTSKGTTGLHSPFVYNIASANTSNAGVLSSQDWNRIDTLSKRDTVTSFSISPSATKLVFTTTKSVVTGSAPTNDVYSIYVAGSAEAGANAGLMSRALADSLLTLGNLSSDWNSVSGSAFISNKPKVLGTGIGTNSDGGYLVSKSASVGEYYLNVSGQWKEVKSSPPITRSAVEPTGDNAIDGAIWLIP